MVKNLTMLLAFVLMTLSQVNAQQTGDEIFVVDIKIDGVTTTYREGAGGFSAPDDWGGPIPTDICAEVAWGYDSSVPSDSLGCDTITNSYSGKAVMIRRGVCEFGVKMFFAQQSGAVIGIVANGTAATHGDAFNAPGMGAGAKGAQVTTTPVMLFCRAMVDVLDNALKAGKKPQVCLRRLSLHDPTGGYAYATPITQADTVDLISMGCVNRSGVSQDYAVKVEITDPNGVSTTITATQFIEAGADSVIVFSPYVPVNPKIGTYKMVYTAELATNAGDTLTREFIYTPLTYATDNLRISGAAANNASFVAAGNKYSALSLYRTGDAGLTVKNATFAINNAAAVAVADPAANVVSLLLLDADPDDNGTTDQGTGVTAVDALPFVAFADYTFDAALKADSLVNVELSPIDGSEVTLKPNHFYYLRALYDGNQANSGIQLALSSTSQVEYGGWVGIGGITPIILDNFFGGGWSGATVVLRLHDAAYPDADVSVKPTPLAATKFSVTPNPAVEYTSVNLELAAQNKSVTVSIIDMQGRIVASQVERNFQSGQIKMDTRSFASGNYALSIRTSEEGSTMTNLMICH